MMLRKRCAYCRGQGLALGSEVPSASPEPCPVCNQRGYNLVPGGAALCGCCQGSGRVPDGGGGWRPCPDCNGIGFKW
jgi:DnaJ-class molecular chaperone